MAIGDPLSGADPARGSIGVRPAGSHHRFQSLPTAVSGGRLIAHWDSDAFPAGSYEFRAIAYDAAGNAGASERRANGARMVLTNPLKTPTAVAAGFGGRLLVWQRCDRRGERRRCRREEVERFEARPAKRRFPTGVASPTAVASPPPPARPWPTCRSRSSRASLPEPTPARRTTSVRTAADGSFSAAAARAEPPDGGRLRRQPDPHPRRRRWGRLRSTPASACTPPPPRPGSAGRRWRFAAASATPAVPGRGAADPGRGRGGVHADAGLDREPRQHSPAALSQVRLPPYTASIRRLGPGSSRSVK